MTLKAHISRKALASTLILLALATAATSSFSQSAFSLESLMGTETFHAAGLNKLSDAEKAELVRWLQSNGIDAGQVSAAAAVAGAEDGASEAPRASPSETQRDEFESRLEEPFTGWSGKTVFQLQNGQVWRQRLPGRYVHREADLPRVRIARNLMGYYEMELLQHGPKIGVSRIR